MESYAHGGCPDSGDSSPRSRDIDCENQTWDDHPQPSSPTSYRAKFMCSCAGKIIPRPNDNKLSYVGGHTKILTVDRTITFSSFLSRISSLFPSSPDDFCFKYQLPGEDLDALISVTNDEDLNHMMLEYDRLLLRSSPKSARLRLFLFPLNLPTPDAKTDRQWFLDALNSAPADVPPTPAVALKPVSKASSPVSEEVVVVPRSNPGKDEQQQIGGENVVPVPVHAAEIQRQIQELQRLQIEQQRRGDEPFPRVFTGDYYTQKPQEKAAVSPAVAPVTMPVPSGYRSERQIPSPTGGFPNAAGTGGDSPVYLISAPVYRPPTTGQGYYVPRVVPDVYRESPVYGVGQPPAQTVAQYGDGVVRSQGVGVAYDSPVREVYYNAPGGVVPSYQTVAPPGMEVRQVPAVVALTQEGPNQPFIR